MLNRFLTRKTLALFSLALLPLAAFADHVSSNTVFAESNAIDGNRVLVFSRDPDGHLRADGSFPTGGFGTGKGLGNQGAVIMSDNDRWLLAVNAGSSEISVFAVRHGDLVLTDIVPSGGATPISLTIDRNLVYVLNAGGATPGNISGFYITSEGRLTAIPGSIRSLSAANSAPAQISFSPSGDTLVVTEKNTNLLDAYQVDDNGVAGAPTFTPSAGQTPFGFAFTPNGKLIVSEAAGGAANASTVSSYGLGTSGQPVAVTSALALKQGAACWVAIARGGRFAYVSNTGSNTVSGLLVAANGSLQLLDASGVTGHTGVAPGDSAVSDDQQYLYVRNSGDNSISQFRIASDGHLSLIGTLYGLPTGASGLVAR